MSSKPYHSPSLRAAVKRWPARVAWAYLLPAGCFAADRSLFAGDPESTFSPVLLVVVGTAFGPVGFAADSPGRLGVVLLTVSPAGGWAAAPATESNSKPAAESIERGSEIIVGSLQVL